MGLLDNAKEAVQLVQKIDNIELYRKILDLQADALKMVEENATLKNQIKSLEEKLKIKDSLTFENNDYWIKREDGSKDGPFCTHCWDREQKLVRLNLRGDEVWSCHTHPRPKKGIISDSGGFSGSIPTRSSW